MRTWKREREKERERERELCVEVVLVYEWESECVCERETKCECDRGRQIKSIGNVRVKKVCVSEKSERNGHLWSSDIAVSKNAVALSWLHNNFPLSYFFEKK